MVSRCLVQEGDDEESAHDSSGDGAHAHDDISQVVWLQCLLHNPLELCEGHGQLREQHTRYQEVALK